MKVFKTRKFCKERIQILTFKSKKLLHFIQKKVMKKLHKVQVK